MLEIITEVYTSSQGRPWLTNKEIAPRSRECCHCFFPRCFGTFRIGTGFVISPDVNSIPCVAELTSFLLLESHSRRSFNDSAQIGQNGIQQLHSFWTLNLNANEFLCGQMTDKKWNISTRELNIVIETLKWTHVLLSELFLIWPLKTELVIRV